MISNQKIISYLKNIADLCGIKKILRSHVAVHTFNLNKIPNNNVKPGWIEYNRDSPAYHYLK